MISFEHVGKRYGAGPPAVGDLSFEVSDGEICVLVGPSGCGKTTSLKMINRLVEPTSGTIRIDGRDTATVDVDVLRRGIGYVIQQIGLFPHLTVAENVATVPRLLHWDRRRARARVDELLELVELPAAEFAQRLPGELSGGQQQRVGVARALGADPPILLMDEPFGAVDPISRERLQDELRRLQGVVRKTIVFVTHDIDEAIKLGDRIVLLNVGGVLAQHAAPADLLAHPASPFVESFLGGSRMVRRLGLVQLRGLALTADGGVSPTVAVDIGATLREALDAVLRAPDGRAAVTDAGRMVGVLDTEAIRRAAQ
ncbi:MAG: ATP-binding cassette domain-containing protein [Chloroflexi bacterium]|nr:MAG: ATP-binding cassette domain-containing protein [Chloroflexota bacterium]